MFSPEHRLADPLPHSGWAAQVDSFILQHPKLTYEEGRADFDPGPGGAWNLANVGKCALPALSTQ